MRSKNRASEAAGPEQATGAQQLILGGGRRCRTGDKLHTLSLSLGEMTRPSCTASLPAQKCQLGAARVLFAFKSAITWDQLFQY